jgi:DNA repair exonuclease SbcCD ATPase subunit
MADNTIEIEVELKGQKETLRGLDLVKDGAEGIGETFKGVGDIVGKTNRQMGENINSLSNAISEGAAAFNGLKEAALSIGQGSFGITTLLGPLALLVTAVGAAYEAYRQASGEAKLFEDRQRALAQAASDLTQKLESLAERGLVPAKEALNLYVEANLRAQLAKELLENRTERQSKVLYDETEARKAATKATQAYFKTLKNVNATYQERVLAETAMKEAMASLQIANQRTKKVFDDLAKSIEATYTEVQEAERQYKSLEAQTEESLRTKAKELTARRAGVETLKAEVEAQSEAELLTRRHNIERSKQVQLDSIEKMNRAQLNALINAHTVALSKLNEEALKATKLTQQIAKLNTDAAKARGGATDKVKAQEAALRQLAIEQQRQMMLESQLRQLQIKLTKEGDDELLALAKERYNTGLQLAKDNALQRQIVEAQYQLDVQQIEDRAIDREYARLQKLDQEAEAKRQKDRAQKQKDRDAQLNADKEMLAQASEYIDMYGQGLAQAGVQALMFGGSFKEAAGEVLKGLAVESGVRALMETAKGFAALLINPALAGGHFKSAALFGAAAGAARVGAGALGVGGAGGASGGATASPSGAPQTAPAPQREQAESREMVFNLNFGGAVIYDTKEAAKRAMLGDLVRTYNQPNRGMPRFSSAR